jgi:hypothetical protein
MRLKDGNSGFKSPELTNLQLNKNSKTIQIKKLAYKAVNRIEV